MDIDWIYCVKCGKGDDVRIQKKMLANLDNNKQPSFSSSWEEMLEIAKAIPMGGKGI